MKKAYLTLMFSLVFRMVYGQGPLAQIQNIGIVSPDAASIGKFGNVPVSYSTGVPDISIPVYQVKAGRISLPVSLNYHAGGVRVDEVPSSAGLGWALNAGGIISRNMVGRPDEINGYLSAANESDIMNSPGAYYGYLYNANSLSDFEPDIFTYSAGDQNGKFIFNKDQSVFQIPLTNNKIVFNSTQGTFNITDVNGIIYYYESIETQYAQVSPITPYTSSWRLSRIVDPLTNETVTLSYQSTNSESESTYDDEVLFTCTPSNSASNGTGSFSTTNNTTASTATTIQHSQSLYLQSISWSGGRITFSNSSDRTDRPGGLRLQSIQVSSVLNGSYIPIKNVLLNQSYFYNNSTLNAPLPFANNDPRNYRLRLDAVGFVSPTGVSPAQYYRMTYNQTPIASRESTGMDMWGFYNGATGNQSRLAVEQGYDHSGNSYTIGNANRSPDASYMNACSLQSMQYPTGGKTVFELEPHQYQDPNTYTHQTLPVGVTSSNGPAWITSSFVYSSNQNLRYSYLFSAYDNNSSIAVPVITITDQTANTQITLKSPDRTRNFDSGMIYNQANSVSFISGHTYQIKADIGTNTNAGSPVSALFTLYWETSNGSPVYKIGGGLRVKSITNYDNNENFISKESYKYGITNEEGYGTLMTDPSLVNVNRSIIYYRTEYTQSPTFMGYNDAPPSYIYHSNSLTSVSMISGSPVLYPFVTKYISNADQSANDGKTIYTYTVVPDFQVSAMYPFDPAILSNDWQNNFMTSETTYKNVAGSYSPVMETDYHYQLDRQQYKNQLKIIKNFTVINGAEYRTPQSVTAYQSFPYPTMPDFTFVAYPRLTGAMLLHDVQTTTYSNNGNMIASESYLYESPFHLQKTQKNKTDSKGNIYNTQYKYPQDFSATVPYNNMISTYHLFSPVVEQLEYITKTVNNAPVTTFLEGTKTDYQAWNGNSYQLYPLQVSTKKMDINSAYDPRVKYMGYDANGNISTISKSGGPAVSYQMGYNHQYPVAQVINATSNEYYYAGFEENTGGPAVPAHTGTQSTASTAVSWTVPNGRSYVISYWYYNNGAWLYSGQLPYSGPTYTLAGGTAYDDIRICPRDAQMSTYTYSPLVGMTSMTDAKGMTTYYENDDFQRLKNIKDKDGNIIKHIDYHYQAQ